jgi:hypothetical protein
VALKPCVYRQVFFKSTSCLIVEHCLRYHSYLKGHNDFGSASPNYQVPDRATVLSLVARVGETVSVSERKRSGYITLLHGMSVKGIQHSLMQSP